MAKSKEEIEKFIKEEFAKKSAKPKTITSDDLLKYEIADELGLLDKVEASGWKSLTAKESGRIGGIMTKRKREQLKNLIK